MATRLNETGDEIVVNDRTNAIQHSPILVHLAGGGFAFIWVDLHTDSIQAQLFDADGNHVGDEITLAALNLVGTVPAATALASGGFALTWVDRNDAGTETLQLAQSFDAAGGAIGTPAAASTSFVSTQSTPSIAALSGGGFIVARDSTVDGTIRGRLLDSAGAPVGGEILLTDANTLSDFKPSLTALATGGFLLAWQESNAHGTVIMVRAFDSAGSATGAAVAVSAAAGAQVQPDVIALASGGFLITWSEFEAGTWDVKARIFDPAGAPAGAAFTVNGALAGAQQAPAAVALPDGGFVIAWEGADGAGIDWMGISAQIFDGSGNRVGDEYLVNTRIADMQYSPTLTLLPDGNVAVGWISGGLFPGPLRGGVVQILDIATVNEVAGDSTGQVLFGTAGVDDIYGGGGNDVIAGDAGRDWLFGEDGNDSLAGGAGRDRLEGGAGQDILDGGAGNDILLGGDDDDLLIYNQSGEDRLDGGAGNDRITATHGYPGSPPWGGSAVIAGGDGNDLIEIDWYAHPPTHGGYALTIDAGAGDDRIELDRLHSYARTQLTLGSGADTVFLGDRVDSYLDSSSGGIIITDFATGAGGDVLDLLTYFDEYAIWDWDGASNPFGSGFLRLRQDGADTILEMRTLLMYDYGFVIRFRNTDASAFTTYNLGGLPPDGSPIAGMTLTGTPGYDSLRGGFGPDQIDGLGENDQLFGGPGNDLLRGGDGNDDVYGEKGNDRLEGGAGNDYMGGYAGNDLLDGGTGADWMAGGPGNDIFIVDNAGDQAFEWETDGLDEVRTNLATYSLLTQYQSGTSYIEIVTGTGDVDQQLTGDDRANVIDGGLGDDVMIGGLGNDLYVVDSFGDTITELPGEGIDAVRTALGTRAGVYTLAANVENLTGVSPVAQAVEGNGLDNAIAMGAGNDLVVLDDGGDDVVIGGAGNDFFYYGAAWTAADRADGGAGTDTIGLIGSTTLTLGANSMVGIERLALYTGLPGAPASYNITTVDSNVAGGAQLFVTAASLQANETLTFNGSAETNGKFVVHGGAGADVIVAGGGSDFLIGNAGDDQLFGLGGADFLIGGLGADQLRGGAGADHFRYQSVAQSTAGSVDRILDFQNLDRIDLGAIDADGDAANGDTAFTYIGAEAFTNVAGQLRAWQSGGDWFVEGDVDGDGAADLILQVHTVDPPPLGAGHFIL